MLPESRAIADAYWARDFGCELSELRPEAPRVRAHAGGLSGYNGAFILALGRAPVVSVPAELAPLLAPREATFSMDAVQDEATLRRLLSPTAVSRVIGPALLAYADASCFRPQATAGARALSNADAVAFAELRAACAAADWDGKEFELESGRTFGAFDDSGALRAIANFRIWGERIAHLGVIADPAATSRGHGTRAAAVAVEAALGAGLLAQYRVLAWNSPSRRIADKLGFTSFGWSVAARFVAT